MFLQKVIGKYKLFHVGPFHKHAGVWNQIQTSISTTLFLLTNLVKDIEVNHLPNDCLG